MKKWIVIAGLLLTSVQGFASPVKIIFTAFQSGGWQLGYPYIADINGVPGVQVMCDDWAHGGVPGQTWYANFTDLGTGDLSLLRFNQQAVSLLLYKEAGWLLLETLVTPKGQTWTDINTAVWYIFDRNTIMTQGAFYWLGQAENEAEIGFPGVDFYKVGIYTPVNQHDRDPNGPQELMTIVPEPGTLLLAAGGLLGVCYRRKVC